MLNRTENISQDYYFNLWFIKLRWIACTVALLLVYLTVKVFHYLDDNNFEILLGLVVTLGIVNLAYYLLIKSNRILKYLKEIQIGIDLIVLTLLLHFTGGLENPLSFLYVFHIILSSILLSKKKSYITVLYALFLYFLLVFSELFGVVSHYTLEIFPHQTEEIRQMENNNEEHQHPKGEIHTSQFTPYVISMSILNSLLLLLTAYFTTNIMERLRSEENKTRVAWQRLEKVLQATNAGLIIIDKEFKIIWYNLPLLSLLNLDNVKQNELDEILDNWINYKEHSATEIMNDGLIRSVEREYLDKNGQKQYFQVTMAPLLDDNGEIIQVVELIQDITTKKFIEAEMLHSAKMVTLGTMAAGIAHEVGNPLASISTRLQLLKSKTEPNFIEKSVSLLNREISRIDRIVRGISQFGRAGKEDWKICNINNILTETIEMLKYHKLSKVSNIDYNFADNMPTTFGVVDQLKQVFLNLGLNALEAIPNGGSLTISTSFGSGYLQILFSDTGEGINENIISKIFQPFYTTKENGSGLGLYIVNHIIESHSGKIEVVSDLNKGTDFKITLPIYSNNQKIKMS